MRLRTLPLCLFLVVASIPAFTQTPAPAVRIVEAIDNSQLVALKGNTLPVANAANDLGRVSPSLAMNGLVLVLSRSAEQQSAFDEFVASQYDSNSPNFHQWLLPAEVGERFGPSLTDIATLSNWLTSRGFAVSAVSKDRMTIRFSGTAEQVQSAFHTEIHRLSVRGEVHIANMSDPQIPMALAPVVAGVKGLHDFKPRPLHKLGSKASFNPDTGKWQRVNPFAGAKTAAPAPAAAGPHPELGITIGSGSSAYLEEDLTPNDFATIYNVLPLWNATTPINGTGQTIAVVGTSDINLADVASFRTAFGLPAGLTPIMVKGANGVDPGVCTATTGTCTIEDLTENSLDVEWSGAVAPGAQVVLVTSGSQSSNDDTVYDSSDYVIQNIGVSGSPVFNAHILSSSYGLCELGEGTSGNAAYNNLWQTASAEGIAVFVASGDAGAATCDQGLDTKLPYAANYGLSVNGIASTPYNTAVGGTDLNWGSTASPYWNASSGTGGASAKGYIPEMPWNDTCTNPLTLTFLQNQVVPALKNAGYSPTSPTDAESGCQFVITWYQTVSSTFNVDISSYVDTVGGGGGVSSCTTSDGQTAASCAGGYAKPSWQTGVTGIPTDGKRDLPDVSFFASNGFLGSAYLFCVTAALPTGVASCSYPTTAATTADQNLISAEEVGGTSVAAPAMAGVMALINQKAGTPQGSPNAELYVLGSQQTYTNCKSEGPPNTACYFNDVDTGTIAMPCQAGSTNCTAIHSGDVVGVQPGYSAAVGYDAATGLGSLNVANVVNAWTSEVGTGTATITVTPSASNIAVSQALTVTVTVNGTNGVTPTGTVTLTGGGFLGSAQTLSNGTNTFSIPAFGITGGSDTLTASYSGDNNYAGLRGTASVTVTKATPGGIMVTPSANSIAASSALTVTGAVSSVAGGPAPTGTVVLTGGGYTSAAATLTNGTFTIAIPANSLSVGSDALTVTYSGDGTYLAGTPGTATVTVTSSAGKLSPTIAVTPGSSSVAASAALTVTGSVTGQSGNPTPTGSVTLTSGTYTSSAASLSGTGAYSITVPASSLIPGTDALVVTYAGDANYSSGGATATVAVTKVAPAGLTVVPSATSIAITSTLTVTGTIAGPTGSPVPTGSVTLAGGGYGSSAVNLTAGGYSITVPALALTAGSDSLTVSYSGDSYYLSGSNSASVTVTKATPTVTATPAATGINSGQSLNVTVAIAGTGTAPTGTVTLTSGTYTSAAQALASGGATIAIPANSLAAGSDTLTVNYSGDRIYNSASSTAAVTVTQSTFALTASATTAVNRGTSATSTISIASTNNYSSTVTFACTLNAGGPANQSGDAPTCTIPTAAVNVGGTATATVTTVAATTGALARPSFRPNRISLAGLGLAALALLGVFGIPAKRQRFRAMLGMLALVFAIGSLAACGGGGGGGGNNGGGGGTSNPGTASGAYTFTVTGTGGDPAKTAATTTFTVTVN